MPALRELQERFWTALVAQAPSPALLDAVRDDPPLAPDARVRIYTDAYLWRLTDALREDHPRLAARLGADAFCNLARAYLTAHPSTHPSIGRAGRGLPEFLAGRADVPPWAGALAALERARQEVFEEADAVALALDDLRTLPPAAWGELPLAAVPACRLVVADWPVHRLWADDDAAGVAPARTVCRVWRQEFRVYHAAIDAAEEAALARLLAGTTFAALCEELDDPAAAGTLLLRWIGDGLVAAPPADPAGPVRS
jgi:putative DNA-binding protein